MGEQSSSQETKEQRFVRIASRRVQEIVKKLQLLQNCANRGNYQYTDDQVRKIFSAIDEELRKVKSEFSRQNSKEKKFRL
ncbi:MAG: hypothetical protein KKF65_03250 [Nanoarchaeota archaeon]|nr:hypothetical protein [Nanoarchaeota archaeon]